MRRLLRCLCLLLLLAEAAGCKSTRQSAVSQHERLAGEAARSLTAVFDSVRRSELSGNTRWEWTQLDYSLDTLLSPAGSPRLRVTRLTRTASIATRHEQTVTDSLVGRSAGQVHAEKEVSARESRQNRTTGLSPLWVVGVLVIVISFIYIIKRR